MEKEIVILTISDKIGNYCVSGIDIHTGQWIRLVSDDILSDGALTTTDLMYENGTICKVLDCIRIKGIEKCETRIQPENYKINRKYKIEYIDTYCLNKVLALHNAEYHNYILGTNVAHYVTSQHISNAGGISLVLVKVNSLVVYNNDSNKKKANFVYNCNEYNKFAVTDKEYYNFNGRINSAYLVISLPGKPLYDKHFKCIAKIFPC